ncbi:hypothetical protein AJ79_05090 [Helicocarpus griseus UAMH5409]|uniref:Uncharacterized protein n=1 Tax=Helicocarpus griseus UAMH5409 TaxID=1447875 RepID=A0A2B7XR10_9EURO|nr:hypothetical protein AJ79_05090 [Helicocarpus griseus UAMH5409]
MTSRTFSGLNAPATTPLNIPILKFSHSTTSADRASPLAWTHLSSNGDLAVIFDQFPPHETSSAFSQGYQCLRVLRGSEILEQLNLNWLARQAAAGPSLLVPNVKPLVAIIVKSPCLAVRYPKGNDQTRRFQIKFASDADYSNAISIFSGLGCPITHSTVNPSNQPSSDRPFSSSSHTPSLLQIGGGTPTLTSSTMSPGISNRPLSGQYLGQQPLSSSGAEHNLSGPFDTSFNNITSTANYGQVNGDRRASSEMFFRPGISNHGITASSSSATTAQAPSGTIPHTLQRRGSHFATNPADLRATSDHFSRDRPSTAPTVPEVESLSQILPPKRELPFAKPRVSQKPRSRKSPVKLAPKPTQLSNASTLFISQSEAAASGTNTETRPSSTGSSCTWALENGGANATSAGYGLARGKEAEVPATADLGDSSPQLISRCNMGTSGASTLEKSTEKAGIETGTFTRTKSLGGVNEINNTSNAENVEPITQTLPGRSTTDCFAVAPAGCATKDEISVADFSSYLTTPSSQRAALVESWVCGQLENDAFLALCQDVEGVWRRIAFGY